MGLIVNARGAGLDEDAQMAQLQMLKDAQRSAALGGSAEEQARAKEALDAFFMGRDPNVGTSNIATMDAPTPEQMSELELILGTNLGAGIGSPEDFGIFDPAETDAYLATPPSATDFGPEPDPFDPLTAYEDTPIPPTPFDFDAEDEAMSMPVVDASGVPNDPQDIAPVIESIQGVDESRFGSYQPKEKEELGLDMGGFAPNMRKKFLNFFGHENDDDAERFGAGLSAFGAGVLTGGTDLGAAMGHGFEKAADAVSETKKTQYDKAMDAIDIEREDELMHMKREEFNDKRKQASLDRMGEAHPDIVRLEREAKNREAGYRKSADGGWEIDPDYRAPASGTAGLGDKKLDSQITALGRLYQTKKIDEAEYDRLYKQIITGQDPYLSTVQ